MVHFHGEHKLIGYVCYVSSPGVSNIANILGAEPFLLSAENKVSFVLGVEAAIQACYGVVNQYLRTIRLLAAKRNACTITYRLPREILGEIMWHALDHRGSYGLSAFERVCRHWRDVALGTPKLWSSIVATSNMHVCVQETLLARAKQAPLSIDISLTSNSDPILHGRATLLLLLSKSNLPRIRRLHLKLSEKSMETLGELYPTPVAAPHLHSLALSLDHDHAQTIRMFSCAGLPSLTKLVIQSSDYHVNRLLPSLSSSNITVFEMSSPGHRARCIVSSAAFQSALRAMPRLEHLTLKDSLLPTNSVLAPSNDPIQFPRIRTLSVETSLLTLSWIFDNIHIVPGVVVTFTYTMDSWHYEKNRHTELGKRVATFLLSEMPDEVKHQKLPLRAVFWDVQQKESTEYWMRFSTGPEVDPPQTPSGKAITVVFPEERAMGNASLLWESSLPLDRVQTLTLRSGQPSYINLGRWRSFQHCLKGMTSLETLRFINWSPESLAHCNVLLWPEKPKASSFCHIYARSSYTICLRERCQRSGSGSRSQTPP